MQEILIDGYNLLYSTDIVSDNHADLEMKRDELLRKLQNFAVKKRSKITVVFDAKEKIHGGNIHLSYVKVMFSPPGKLADDVIRAMIRKSKKPQNLLVVSSDNEIRRTARDHSATSVTSQEFANQLHRIKFGEKSGQRLKESTQKYDPEINDADLAFWKKLFENRKEDT
jgi:predicted RNA-binding protein with PIN domain